MLVMRKGLLERISAGSPLKGCKSTHWAEDQESLL